MIEGISHVTFIVSNLDKMEEILTKVLDARKVYDSGDKTFSHSKERFFDIGGIWVAIMEGDPLPTKTYNHIAFKIDADYFLKGGESAFCPKYVSVPPNLDADDIEAALKPSQSKKRTSKKPQSKKPQTPKAFVK